MNNRKFTLWNRIVALAVFLVAAVTYLLTIEPTASFWDCGEFIASSYKLEVGHPPGNPVFQLFARVATMFTGPENAAVAVNAMNAILSALTILLLYLTTVFLVKRLVKPAADGSYSVGQSVAIFGSGAVAALAYTFSDTFWFSAVEGEVYAMSSLFTALVFWAMTKWYEQADQPYANRWLVLIAFLMGLSIGVHLLNLLTIPALVFMFFYRKREDMNYSFGQLLGIFLISVVILAVVLYGIIPLLPRIAAYFDLFFVNTLGLPFNSGAAFFMITLLALCFVGLFITMKKGNALLNTILLCFTMIVIGFSLFTIVIIRSCAKTPTNEYQPDNPFTLVRYLGREQYGSNPLVYGQTFDSPYTLEEERYWAPMPYENADRYIHAKAPDKVDYPAEGKMLFPRMWSNVDSHKQFYMSYIGEDPKTISYKGESYVKPTFFQNLKFFFDYQMNWMYWRYFMWNFAGRQNDLHGEAPNQFAGNWECGIGFIDDMRLEDQSDAPAYLSENKGKNHYYLLPLILGLIGLFYQFASDKRGSWVTFLMFFMTGIAIVIYLNQPPYQVRERDYAYAGSFYAFSIWIGMAVVAVYAWITDMIRKRSRSAELVVASCVTVSMLGVPALMAAENWDDHDRSNRYTAVEMAANYLNSVGENGILVTHGDNDTFPLWYAQEVENIRPDVRIANTSLLGTDWHIDQMKWATNESAPLNLKLGYETYLYGTNEFAYIYEEVDENDNKIYDNKPLSEVMKRFGKAKLCSTEYGLIANDDPYFSMIAREGESEEIGNFLSARRFTIPVNKENVIRYGILDEKYLEDIPDSITLTIPADKNYITKPELFMLDLLSNYQWDRPLHLLNMGGDINVGLKEYLQWDGFSYKFVPIKNRMSSMEIGFADPDDLYYKMKNVFKWDALKRTDYFVDYHNFFTFCGVLSQRQIFVNVAKELMDAGENEKAIEMLDMCQECVPVENYPLDIKVMGLSNEYWVLQMIALYYDLGEAEKAEKLAEQFMNELNVSKNFFHKLTSPEAADFYEDTLEYIKYVAGFYVDMMLDAAEADGEKASKMADRLSGWVSPSELPAETFWDDVILTYDILEDEAKAKALAKSWSVTLCEEMDYVVSEYQSIYTNYYEPLYNRYSSSAKKSQADVDKLLEYKRVLESLDAEMQKIMQSMGYLYYTADELGMSDIADTIYEKMSMFAEE